MLQKTRKLIWDYIKKSSWRVKENANMTFSHSGMVGFVANYCISDFVLAEVLPPEAAEAHTEGYIHIHDLSGGTQDYCMGIALDSLLYKGLEDGEVPRHFLSAMGIMMNALYTISQEVAGAVAFNAVDALMAPYIKKDKLSYDWVKQIIQTIIYSINVKGRIGFQAPFCNFQLDITVPKRLKDQTVVIDGEVMPFTYGDCQAEMDMFNKALLEVMMEARRVLSFPVINIGVTRDFDWDSPLAETIFRAVGSMGQPTINNYVSGEYDPDSVKSMCCSLRLDMTKLFKQAGGQFGSGDNTGSIGVVTINMPMLAAEAAGDKAKLFDLIDHYMDIADIALTEKRGFIEMMMKNGMFPYLKRFVDDFSNFFSTIGVIGLNEMCLNMGLPDISHDESVLFVEEVMDHMNSRLVHYQEMRKTFYGSYRGVVYNLELVPGEGATYRLAKHMKKKYPNAHTANGTGGMYLTRGCWLPADKQFSLRFSAQHQSRLQKLFSGGANWQWHFGQVIHDWRAVRDIIYKLVNETELPFISLSPVIAVCPICGKLQDDRQWCEHELTPEQIAELRQRGIEIDETR
ncbi:ribonucleoside triphosphate reductase [Anaeroselena agilis]|uniref:Ribonucleoside triphosphate reductase n=1 Tax=Anaeroselena agilis TaxID=3063788 RepID=A0ABU3NVQ5_9FIRM|nr:ribonucleoside triphosphate reductase [Selenomonadales bacterium 4137-cl]